MQCDRTTHATVGHAIYTAHTPTSGPQSVGCLCSQFSLAEQNLLEN